MKDITTKLIGLLKKGYCTPQIARIAKTIKEPATTIHYNLKKLEREGMIKTYKAIFNYKKIDEGHCTYVLVNFIPEKYGEPDEVAKDIAKHPQIESVDICTGDYELIMKIRSRDIDDYYQFIKFAIKRYGFAKVVSITSLKQVKTEFVEL